MKKATRKIKRIKMRMRKHFNLCKRYLRRIKRTLEQEWAGFDVLARTTAFTLALLIILSSGPLQIASVLAYYEDTEATTENAFVTSTLDFALTNQTKNIPIGLGQEKSFMNVITNQGALDFQYEVVAEKQSGSDAFCQALNMQAKFNGVKKYEDVLLNMATPTSTTMGTWRFEVELPVDATGIAHGDKCVVDLVFRGWQKELADYASAGFSDEERISLTLTASMIVMNEFLPNPTGDDGELEIPNDEWVELYNNGTNPMDLTDWYLKDAANHKIDFSAMDNVLAPNLTILGKGFMVVHMGGAILNNDVETISLYDDNDNLIDTYTYNGADYCTLTPTPGADNSSSTSGDCNNVPTNKSYARIPDGIGDWVDPVPTPGHPNRLDGAGQQLPAASGTPAQEQPHDEEDVIADFSETAAVNDAVETAESTETETGDGGDSSAGGDEPATEEQPAEGATVIEETPADIEQEAVEPESQEEQPAEEQEQKPDDTAIEQSSDNPAGDTPVQVTTGGE